MKNRGRSAREMRKLRRKFGLGEFKTAKKTRQAKSRRTGRRSMRTTIATFARPFVTYASKGQVKGGSNQTYDFPPSNNSNMSIAYPPNDPHQDHPPKQPDRPPESRR